MPKSRQKYFVVPVDSICLTSVWSCWVLFVFLVCLFFIYFLGGGGVLLVVNFGAWGFFLSVFRHFSATVKITQLMCWSWSCHRPHDRKAGWACIQSAAAARQWQWGQQEVICWHTCGLRSHFEELLSLSLPQVPKLHNNVAVAHRTAILGGTKTS